jgi:Zn-dependent peptidase ImmA (M78 family)
MKKVNPQIIQWAMEWNGLKVEDLQKAFPKLAQWLDGTHEPTFKQLEKFAIKTHTIVPYFYMQTIPDVRLQIADFRRINPEEVNIPSPELFDTIDELLNRQAWLRDYFVDEGSDKLDWVGRFAGKPVLPDTMVVTDYLHGLLGLDKHWASRREINSVDEAWRTMRKAIESLRVAICVSGYAGANTMRAFRVNEFRGFALSDEYAPVVFVNGVDAKTAQIFTLVHEMVHLLFFQTGVSSPFDLETPIDDKTDIEKYCDQIAADFLVPAEEFTALWSLAENNEDALRMSRKQFKVSTIVILRRALDLGLISKQVFWSLYEEYSANKDGSSKPRESGGGDYYKNQGTKLGTVFTEAVYTALKAGDLQFSEAYKMTGLRGKNLDRYYEKLGLAL